MWSQQIFDNLDSQITFLRDVVSELEMRVEDEVISMEDIYSRRKSFSDI